MTLIKPCNLARCLPAAIVLLLGAAPSTLPTPSPGEDQVSPGALVARPVPGPDEETRPEPPPITGLPEPGREAGPDRPIGGGRDAEVVYDGVVTPGSRVTLGPAAAVEPGATFRWSQYEGPPAEFGDPARPRIQVTVPPGARRLGFLLTIRDARGAEQRARVVIPVRAPAPRAGRGGPRADAGDDQVGLVGHRITLNGSRSAPSGKVGYRWFQIAGPRAQEPAQEGQFFSFVPAAPGRYRFGLVVAAGSVASEPDEVSVLVGELPSTAGLDALRPPGEGASAAEVARALLEGAGPADGATLERVAAAFEAIAERMSLYATFADMASEMTRRLDAAVPTAPPLRQVWAQGVFAPLSQQVVAEMLAAGLDLRQPQGHQQALTPAQKERLRAMFSACSVHLRSRPQQR